MSLLIVRCSLKPFVGANSGASGASGDSARDWQDMSYAEKFDWRLIDQSSMQSWQSNSLADTLSDSQEDVFSDGGTGSTESMPYADEVLVLMLTIDVRLIEAKIPLANAKKLQQILPNLIEKYVLAGGQTLSVKALPPAPGKPAIQRVIALIDRAWYTWLTKQLEGLISQRVRLIPDCLFLESLVLSLINKSIGIWYLPFALVRNSVWRGLSEILSVHPLAIRFFLNLCEGRGLRSFHGRWLFRARNDLCKIRLPVNLPTTLLIYYQKTLDARSALALR